MASLLLLLAIFSLKLVIHYNFEFGLKLSRIYFKLFFCKFLKLKIILNFFYFIYSFKTPFRFGCLSFLRAFASICLILSLVTSKIWPISSRVFILPSSIPYLNLRTSLSLGLRVAKTPSKSSLSKVLETSCSGFSISASIKSPSLESSSVSYTHLTLPTKRIV